MVQFKPTFVERELKTEQANTQKSEDAAIPCDFNSYCVII